MYHLISPKVGSEIADYTQLLNSVGQIIGKLKVYQKGRLTDDVGSPTFNFTQGWFSKNGLYDLQEKHQQRLINNFIQDK